ncbi:MAG: AMP-binding protein, partial [Burkholderiales bacterium]
MPVQPSSRTLPGLLSEMAARLPESEAIVFGKRRLRWRELAQAVDDAARGLASLGVQSGDKVAPLMGN